MCQCSNCEIKVQKLSEKKSGDIVSIYLKDDFGVYKKEGEAKLVRPVEGLFGNVPFPYEYCEECNSSINVVKKKWLVEFVSDNRRGFVTSRYILEYHSKGLIKIFDEEE